MALEEEPLQYLKDILDSALDAFDGLADRWQGLQPHKLFNIKYSEDFHVGCKFYSKSILLKK